MNLHIHDYECGHDWWTDDMNPIEPHVYEDDGNGSCRLCHSPRRDDQHDIEEREA